MAEMKEIRVGVVGAGFWARYQIAAWRELPGVKVVGVFNRTVEKAKRLGQEFGIEGVYGDVEQMLDDEKLDVVDVITDVDTHSKYTRLAAERRVTVICQKPMGNSLSDARGMAEFCRSKGVDLLIHENWRWQTPLREVKRVLDSGVIGRVFRARIRMVSGFDLFANQPFLRELHEFLLTDIGSHILDVARWMFGEPDSLFCRTTRVHADIKGEDVATVMLVGGEMPGGGVVCEMGYAGNPQEHENFPETVLYVEGERGTVELSPYFWLKVTTREGGREATHARRVVPPRYVWANPQYDVVHSSIVPCCADLLGHLRGEAVAETTAADNLKTVELVFGSYQSARSGGVVKLPLA
jgi:predicted dehydrogenase